MKAHSDAAHKAGKRIAFVPTMGFLHEGHLSLMRKAREHADEVVISIFVNPAQFGPNEDFDSYPRAVEEDIAKATGAGAHTVFLPTEAELYPDGFQTYVELEKLPRHLCGLSRPVFFKGIATVVTKLFNIVRPDVAVFGEKDFQQLAIIRQMVRDLHLDVEILGGPIVREKDGLAMSSRNAYLTPDQRSAATFLHETLGAAQKMVATGERNPEALRKEALRRIGAVAETTADYISICDPDTLDEVETIDGPVLMAMAVMLGKTRLIDNRVLTP